MSLSVPQSVDTKLWLCKNVLVDPSYNHVYDFSSKAQQERYFLRGWLGGSNGGKAFYIFDGEQNHYGKLTFQRVGQGFRVPIPREMLEDEGINYLVFSNKRYDPYTQKNYEKKYYCFISSIDYINENVSEIKYVIDVYQTFLFDFRIKPCFVEREMVSDDRPGKNIITEGIGYGEYVQHFIEPNSGGINPMFPNDEWSIVVAATFNRNHEPINNNSTSKGAYNYFGIASGLAYIVFNTINGVSAVDSLAGWIRACVAQNDITGIQAAYAVPRAITRYGTGAGQINYDDDIEPDGDQTNTLCGNVEYNIPTTLGSYEPINKKLLTYPYNMLFLTNNNSASKIYKWEYFEQVEENSVMTNTASFGLFGCAIMPVEAAMVPIRYNGQGISGLYNMWERLVMTDFPICSFDIDVFSAYMAANKFKIGTQVISSMIDATIGFGSIIKGPTQSLGRYKTGSINDYTQSRTLNEKTGRMRRTEDWGRTGSYSEKTVWEKPPETHFQTDFNSLLSIGGTLADIATKPPEAIGETTNILNMSTSMAGFTAYQTCIRPEYAKVIDDYFSKFGYAIHEIKQPNLTNRPLWNYVKTLDCIVVPNNVSSDSISISEMNILQAIFDSGVTIWHCLKNSDGDLSGEAEYGNYSQTNMKDNHNGVIV